MPALSDTLWLEMFYCPVYLLYLLSHRSLLLLLVCSNVNDFNFFLLDFDVYFLRGQR